MPSPLTPSVIAAPAVGVVIFEAGDYRCRGIVGSSNCACVVIGCDVVLHQRVDRKAPVLNDVAYICCSGPSKTVHITPALAMSEVPSWMVLFIALPRCLLAQRTLFTILSSCSALRLDTLMLKELNTRIFGTSSWGLETPSSVLSGTARKRKPDFAEQLEAVAEDETSESLLSRDQHEVFNIDEVSKPNRLISTEEEMYKEWPKLVTSILSLRTQLVAFGAIKANSDAGVEELLTGLDDKLAILKGLIGALPHLDLVVAELGVDVFLVLDGLAGTVYKSKSLLNQSLQEMLHI